MTSNLPDGGGPMTHILLNLADILDQACAIVEEERGQALSPDLEHTIAKRITQCAELGERDREKILTVALLGLVTEEFSLSRALLN